MEEALEIRRQRLEEERARKEENERIHREIEEKLARKREKEQYEEDVRKYGYEEANERAHEREGTTGDDCRI